MMIYKYTDFLKIIESKEIVPFLNYVNKLTQDEVEYIEPLVFHKISNDVASGVTINNYIIDNYVIDWKVVIIGDVDLVANSIRNGNISGEGEYTLCININKSITESITAKKSNLLYHSTDKDSLLSMLLQNKIACTTPQEIDGDIVRGVSFTTNPKFIYKNYPITIIINSDCLNDNYNKYSIDFFKTKFGAERASTFNIQLQDESEVFVTPKNKKIDYIKLDSCLSTIRINDSSELDDDTLSIIKDNYPNVKIIYKPANNIKKAKNAFKIKYF